MRKSGSKFETNGNPAELPIHLLWALIQESWGSHGHEIILRDVVEGALFGSLLSSRKVSVSLFLKILQTWMVWTAQG